MSDPNTAIYALNALGPTNIVRNANDVCSSGFSTILLGLFHIGRGPDMPDPKPGQHTGDIVFNNPDDPKDRGLIAISRGEYVGPKNWPDQLEQLLKIKNSKSHVTRIGCSVGGGGVEDYHTIWTKFVVNGSISQQTDLYKNFKQLKEKFSFIDFIDFDCEEFGPFWTDTLIAFGRMLKDIKFNITLCPYGNPTQWMKVLKSLYAKTAPTVLWMNLQCYAGGAGSNPASWAEEVAKLNLGIDGASFIVPGLWCCNTEDRYQGKTPPMMQKQFETWKKGTKLSGGFIWKYDDILVNQNSTTCNPSYSGPKTSAAYQSAIVKGLGP
jgi:hypothetical protein